AARCGTIGMKLPSIIGPETASSKVGAPWLDKLFSNGWGDSIDRAGVHYYSHKRSPTYVEHLAAFASAAGDKPLWDSEFHWNDTEKGDYFDAKYGLMSAFDHFDVGFDGITWWAFNPGSLGTLTSEMQSALVESTAGARPIDVDDQDGVVMAAGKLNTRA